MILIGKKDKDINSLGAPDHTIVCSSYRICSTSIPIFKLLESSHFMHKCQQNLFHWNRIYPVQSPNSNFAFAPLLTTGSGTYKLYYVIFLSSKDIRNCQLILFSLFYLEVLIAIFQLNMNSQINIADFTRDRGYRGQSAFGDRFP